MGLGNGYPKSGDKGSNFDYEYHVLKGLDDIATKLEAGGSGEQQFTMLNGAASLDNNPFTTGVAGYYSNTNVLFFLEDTIYTLKYDVKDSYIDFSLYAKEIYHSVKQNFGSTFSEIIVFKAKASKLVPSDYDSFSLYSYHMSQKIYSENIASDFTYDSMFPSNRIINFGPEVNNNQLIARNQGAFYNQNNLFYNYAIQNFTYIDPQVCQEFNCLPSKLGRYLGAGYISSGNPTVKVLESSNTTYPYLVIGNYSDLYSYNVNGSYISRGQLAFIDENENIDNSFPLCYTNGAIYTAAFDSQGRLYLGGSFTTYTDITGTIYNCYNFIRLNSDYTFDPTFNNITGYFNTVIWEIVIQSDDKILVGTDAGTYIDTVGNINSIPQGYCRLLPDGLLDPGFSINSLTYGFRIESIFVDSTNKIYLSGALYNDDISFVRKEGVIRLNSDGTVDSSFLPGSWCVFLGVSYSVFAEKDGKVYISSIQISNENPYGGIPDTIYFRSKPFIRINLDGTLDDKYYIKANPSYGLGNVFVRDIQFLDNGDILAVGIFDCYSQLNGSGFQTSIVRIKEDDVYSGYLYELALSGGAMPIISGDGYGAVVLNNKSMFVFGNISSNIGLGQSLLKFYQSIDVYLPPVNIDYSYPTNVSTSVVKFK